MLHKVRFNDRLLGEGFVHEDKLIAATGRQLRINFQ